MARDNLTPAQLGFLEKQMEHSLHKLKPGHSFTFYADKTQMRIARQLARKGYVRLHKRPYKEAPPRISPGPKFLAWAAEHEKPTVQQSFAEMVKLYGDDSEDVGLGPHSDVAIYKRYRRGSQLATLLKKIHKQGGPKDAHERAVWRDFTIGVKAMDQKVPPFPKSPKKAAKKKTAKKTGLRSALRRDK